MYRQTLNKKSFSKNDSSKAANSLKFSCGPKTGIRRSCDICVIM